MGETEAGLRLTLVESREVGWISDAFFFFGGGLENISLAVEVNMGMNLCV